MSPTQFAWSCLGRPPWPPPRPAPEAICCWLCAGPLDQDAWRREDALPSTFAQHDDAACKTSPAVCAACAFFAVGATWQAWLADARAPKVKAWTQASWRSYGHFFRLGPTPHECPSNARWRELLLEPPEPPFLAVLSLTGQKNLIFRAAVAQDRDCYPLQVEEDRAVVRRADLAECVGAVESALAAGLGREEIATGEAHQARILALGIRRWRAIEATLAPWRRRAPMLLGLACRIGTRPAADAQEPAPATIPPPARLPTGPAGQMELL